MNHNQIEQVFLKIVENQLAKQEPRSIRHHYLRLESLGYERKEILVMMAGLTAHLTQATILDDQPFDNQRYDRLLGQLPNLPEF